MFGTKMRSVVKAANRSGIAAVVSQQLEVGQRIAEAGLMPILEPEYDIASADRAEGEAILRDEILTAIEQLPDDRSWSSYRYLRSQTSIVSWLSIRE